MEVRFGGTQKPTLGTEEAEGTSGGWWVGEPSVLPGAFRANVCNPRRVFLLS